MRVFSRDAAGLGIVELLIALALSAAVAVLGYRTLIHSTRLSKDAIQRSQTEIEIQKFAARLDHEMTNAIAIPRGLHTALGSIRPGRCNIDHITPLLIPSGLAPYPNYTRTRIANLSSNPEAAAIDPSYENSDPLGSDALRIAYFPGESQSYTITQDVTTPTYSIEISFDPAKGDPFSVGDFALISNDVSSDLIRITSVRPQPPDRMILDHDSTRSAWNIDFTKDYKVEDGRLTLQRVNLVTYALHTDQTIYGHDHQLDDGFLPASGLFGGGSAGMNLNNENAWTPVARNVTRFQIWFEEDSSVALLDPVQGNPKITRRPLAALPTDILITGTQHTLDQDCRSQTSSPRLKRLKIHLEFRVDDKKAKTLERSITPMNVLLGYLTYGSADTVGDPPFYETGPPAWRRP